MFTNGILQHRISVRPPDSLRTGADSFKRVLGGSAPRLPGPIPPYEVVEKEQNSCIPDDSRDYWHQRRQESSAAKHLAERHGQNAERQE